MTVITMSRNELRRLRVLIDIADGRLSVADATGLMGVGRRQIYLLLDSFRARGPDGVISRNRGRIRHREGVVRFNSAGAVQGDGMPSRPGELHPEPLTDPDLILSHHPARATVRRLPPSVACQVPPVAG